MLYLSPVYGGGGDECLSQRNPPVNEVWGYSEKCLLSCNIRQQETDFLLASLQN